MAKRKRRPARQPEQAPEQGPPAASQPAADPANPYNHVEAFCLMRYRCKLCGQIEVLWNSRDGVTPFIILCNFCRQGEAMHVDWHLDRRAINYMPASGQRIFVDLPDSLKAPLARVRVERMKGTPYEAKSEAEAEARVKAIINNIKEGEPWIITWS